MTHKYIYRFSELADTDPVRKFIVLALHQAARDGATEVTVGVSCDPDISVVWSLNGSVYSLGMPSGVSGSQVRETLAAMAGLDGSGAEPKESELVVEFGDMSMAWLVSSTDFQNRITLNRKS